MLTRKVFMIPVILSGGSGTRLWPVSRESYPKQFCELFDHSFLNDTALRLKPIGEPWVITLGSMSDLTRRALKELKLDPEKVISEPMGKNTAPAVALMCHIFNLKGKGEEVVGIFPADHIIQDHELFLSAMGLAEQKAKEGFVVTLGMSPTYPADGYGYIELESKVESGGEVKAYSVSGFKEKPDQKTAQSYIESGRYVWNAGIFVFQVKGMIEYFKSLMPELWSKIETIKDDLSNLKYIYANLESQSFDYGIMEKLKEQVSIPCDIGWSDVGSWDEISRLSEDARMIKSHSRAKVVGVNSNNNYIFSPKDKVVGLIGVQSLLIVDTPDALLISKKGDSQKVKELVGEMKQLGLSQVQEHKFEMRPWGGYEILHEQKECKVKRISVDPGAQLSYQSHEKRDEHWVVVMGEAEVTINDEVKKLKAGQNVFIPRKSKHRIKNPGTMPMVFVEVQTGDYFGEDDIKRYQDDYNRC